MNKIAVISMVKNEADIIEHFVRHCLTFADIIIVMDHDSCDGTSAILHNIQKEDNRLIVYKSEIAGYEQSKLMTAVMHEATIKYNADVVVPLDADEFILTISNKTIRESILSLPRDTVCSLDLIWYRVNDISKIQRKFILQCPGKKLNKFGGRKVLITSGKWKWSNMMLGQGNHHVLRKTQSGWADTPTYSQQCVFLAHFARRSYEQQISKFIVGWIHNVAKHSKYCLAGSGWGDAFHALLTEKYRDEDSEEIVLEYDSLSTDSIDIKYHDLSQVNYLKNIQITAEKMANKLAICECILSDNKADIIILDNKLNAECSLSLMSIRLQDKAVDTVFIVTDNESMGNKIKDDFLDLHIKIVRNISEVGKLSKARYIQLMLSGDELRVDKIGQSMAAIYQYPDVDAIYFNGIESNEYVKDIILERGSRLPYLSGTEFVMLLKKHEQIPSGGISGYLFKRNILLSINWFEKYELNGKLLIWLGLGHMIMECKNIAVINSKEIKSIKYDLEMLVSYKMEIEAL